jgi:hypothetical protein
MSVGYRDKQLPPTGTNSPGGVTPGPLGSGTSKPVNWRQNQPAPVHAIRMLKVNFPQVKDLGIYVCRNVKGTDVKSAHAQGRALDIGLRADRPAEKMIGDGIFRALIRAAHSSGIDNVIWNRQIWSQSHGGPRKWEGHYKNGVVKTPHVDHLHVEWTHEGSQQEQMNFLELQIAILRGGLEDLSKSLRDLA